MIPTMANNINEIIKNISGWLTPNEADLLYSLAKRSNETIVEIGTWKGKSTICLGIGSKEGNRSKVITIDPHFPAFFFIYTILLKNIKKTNVSDVVTPIKSTSLKVGRAFTEPIDLLFIDGLHQYEYVIIDFLLWEKHVIKDGLIAFHDSNVKEWPQVQKVINDYIAHSKRFEIIKIVDSITVIKKLSGASALEKEENDKALNNAIKKLKPLYVALLYDTLQFFIFAIKKGFRG
jgi:predicted O-methyltransferase YrrM